jgi:dipeptidyl aminopeptidase/acylaminoacyl peptidase
MGKNHWILVEKGIMHNKRCNIIKLIILVSLIMIYRNSIGQERREIGNLVLEGIPKTPIEIKIRLQQYQNTRSANIEDWLPGGKGMLITTRFGNTRQYHIIEHPRSSRDQITFFHEPVGEASFCRLKDYNGFLFTKDIGGNERSQIYWYDMETRKAEMISDGVSVNELINWSNNGNLFAFTSTRRNNRDYDIYISDISSLKKAELKISKGDGYWVTRDWSPKDDQLIVVQYRSLSEANSFILDINSNILTRIYDKSDIERFVALGWNSTGDKIYALTNKGREFNTLVQYDVVTKKINYITEDIPWDIDFIEFALNKSRSLAAFVANENGFSKLYILDTRNNQYIQVDQMPNGQIYSLTFHPSKDILAFVLNSSQTPGDIYTLNLVTNKIERWTKSEVGGLYTDLFPEPELVSYESFDKVNGRIRKVPAFIYKPNNTEVPLPVLIDLHGSEDQHMPYFSSFRTFLVNELGIAVIAPNYRGSTGYGKSYHLLDNGYNRENAVKDINKLFEWIEANNEFDASRIAVYGSSYGGYMVLSSMVHYNNKIKCGIDICGISNFVTFLSNTEEYRRDLRRLEYGDERDPNMKEFLLSISPITHAERITKPLFVIQGANDPRVPVTESEQMVNMIRENNGIVWYMLAKDEGHGYRKKENRNNMHEAITLFLMEYLLIKQCP